MADIMQKEACDLVIQLDKYHLEKVILTMNLVNPTFLLSLREKTCLSPFPGSFLKKRN